MPECLALLPSLQGLDLYNNQLSGPLPLEALASLPLLTDLWLSSPNPSAPQVVLTNQERQTLLTRLPKCKVRI